jgi:Uma2 family endonuclease
MADPATRQPLPSVEEYLRMEEASSVRHEYVAGQVHALAGATKRHNRIALNVVARLIAAAGDGPCRVYASDVKLRVGGDIVYYPDVMVACGPNEADPLVERKPCLVVEVTSPSTEVVDRREKAMVYKTIPTLEAYLIVHQNRRRVERHWRDEQGVWWHADAIDGGRVPVPCPPVELTMEQIYAGVELATPEEDEETPEAP